MGGGEKLWKGAVSGAVAGLAASFAMNGFQALWSKVQGGGSQGEDETATMKAADFTAHKVLDRELTKEEEKKAAPMFHYGFGTAMGALYGVLAEELPITTVGFGTVYGTILFLAGDEAAVPLMGLSTGPTEVPLSSHIEALASHLVYGASAESVRRGMRAALKRENLEYARESMESARENLEYGREKARSTLRQTKKKAREAQDMFRETKDRLKEKGTDLAGAVHWEVESRTERPRKASKIKHSARRAWEEAAA